ncbi:MAG: hexitol phosphatase HxpB [Bacteroidia bacterium]
MNIQAVIFDMDGLIVDSEPYWRVAETEVFGALSQAPDEEEFEQMMGNRIQEVIESWYMRHPWENASFTEVRERIVNRVADLVIEKAGLKPGFIDTLDFFKQKNIPVALASSSPMLLIERLMKHYNVDQRFNLLCSAEHEAYGKPHPAVFLTTAEKLNVYPEKCLVFEDSFNGVLAAKAARMKCVAVPAAEHFHQQRFCIADAKLASLTEFNEEVWNRLNH